MYLHVIRFRDVNGGGLLAPLPVGRGGNISESSKVKVLLQESSGFPGLEETDLIQFFSHVEWDLK